MPPAFVSCAAVLVRCNNTLSMLLALETKKALANLYVLGALEPTRLVQLSAKRRANGTNARKALRCYVVGAARCGKVCGAANGCCDRVHPCRLIMRVWLCVCVVAVEPGGWFLRSTAGRSLHTDDGSQAHGTLGRADHCDVRPSRARGAVVCVRVA